METYRYLSNGHGLYLPPTPAAGVVVAPHQNLPVGQNFPPEVPIRHPEYPNSPLPQKAYQNRSILRPGEQSLDNYKVDVWDERIYKHVGVNRDSQALGYTPGRDEVLGDTAVITHHSGQQVRYKIDQATGLYVFRGYVNPTHRLDAPTWGNKNYYHQIDRSDFWETPPPLTQLSESNPPVRPVEYSIAGAQFYKPLPDQFNAHHMIALTDQDKSDPTRAGTALTNKTQRY